MKILVSPTSFGQVSMEPVDMLLAKGYELVYNKTGRKLKEEEVIALGKECDGIVAGLEPLTAKVMDELTNLKCISRVGVGMDSVDMEYAASKGIIVVNTPDGPTRSVAELTLGMTLSLLRKIPQSDAAIKNGNWKKYVGNLLHQKTVGVIGLGRIGKMVAQMFAALGNPVIGYDLYRDESWAKQYNVTYTDLDSVLKTADIITIHTPGNKDKVPVVGQQQLAMIKTGSFLINISRGDVVDETALYTSLTNGHLAGAAIDAFSEEPYIGPLATLDNVVLTPHI
jgi:D-3-phosphoglycerate dehydrogenase